MTIVGMSQGKERTFRRFRLSTYLLALALALLIPALGLGAAVSWRAVVAYRGAFEGRLQDTARALALAVDREIGVLEATMTGLATTRLLDEGASEADLAEFHARAREVAKALGTWVVVSGPGPEYQTQVHTLVPPGVLLGTGLRLPIADAPLPRVFATGRPAVGGVALGRLFGRPVSFVFVPVIRGGRVIRALGMALDPARIARVLEGQGLSGQAFAAVVDARGNTAARSRDHELFVGRPAPAWFTEAVAGREAGFLRGPGLEGQELVVGFAHLSATPGWTVAVTEPWAAYTASWRQPLEALTLGGSLIIAFGVALALGLARRLIRPLAALARDAQAFAVGGASETLVLPSAVPSAVTEFEELRRGLAAADAALRERAAAKREANERQALLIREVDHRAKNALAVALSLVRLAPRAVPPERFAASVEGRIAAMARAHSLLAKGAWSGADLQAVVEGELAPYLGHVHLVGPQVQLAAEAVQSVAILLHELATNAAKHGALSVPAGKVSLTWDRGAEHGRLNLEWVETGGPPVPGSPERRGFGARLIAQLAERQLGGRIWFDWRAAGLHASLALPARVLAPGRGMLEAKGADGISTKRNLPDVRARRGTPGINTGRGLPPRVLVVEDEVLLSLEVEAALHELGCEVVGPARSLDEALRLAIGETALHAAVLDVNLGGGERSFPVADLLETRGVPYIFVTGYASAITLADRGTSAVAVLRKPYAREILADAVSRALRGQRETG